MGRVEASGFVTVVGKSVYRNSEITRAGEWRSHQSSCHDVHNCIDIDVARYKMSMKPASPAKWGEFLFIWVLDM
ncbi:hypothetical protein BDZ89DRAFT_1062510 [Hymenopellis radicata]|nr:hypothetical protein BDZ89DRAFT_1062510 [Hymenopellis radicata]